MSVQKSVNLKNNKYIYGLRQEMPMRMK